MRTTAQPLCLKARDARLSLRRFPSIFSRQARALVLAVRFRPQSCPCQKQPSTNTATFIRGHAKSGRPGRSWCRRQPPILSPRRRNARRFSVVAFPLPRTRDMSSPRRSPPNGVHSRRALPGHSLTIFCARAGPDGGEDLSRYALGVEGRHSVADEITHHVPVIREKAIALWKRLEDRRFAYGDRVSTSVRVPKSPFARCRASSRDRRRDTVPRHPAVYVGESFVPIAVTLGSQGILYGQPGFTGLRRLEPFFRLCLQVRHNVPIVRGRSPLVLEGLQRHR